MTYRWPREENVGPGWTLGYSIIVPAPDVYGPADTATKRPVVYRAAPPPSHSAIVSLLWATPSAPARDHPPSIEGRSRPMARLDLSNGDRLWIVAFDKPMVASDVAEFTRLKRSAFEELSAASPGFISTNRRVAVHGARADGSAFVLDLSLDVAPEAYQS